MKKILLFLVFSLLFLIRWISIESPLPESWTPESKIRFTATINQEPEYTDSQTIVRYGIWYIKMRGYAVITPGSKVSFVGTVTPKVLGKKIVKLVMVDPTFEVIGRPQGSPLQLGERIILFLGSMREKWVSILEKTLPEPMSSLAAGILLGVKSQMPQDFYDSLVETGTLHIVAASGYNVSIVATVLMNLLIGLVSRGVAIWFGIVGVIFYVLISGGSASVVRAGIMGSLTLIAYYFGRASQARRLLWVTAAIMLIMSPLLIMDVGFQLSFVATWGLLYIEPLFRGRRSSDHSPIASQGSELGNGVRRFLSEYLYPTLAATVATMPIILWHFGRVSWISPLVNIFVLPLVPLVMFLTAIVIVVGSLSMGMGQLMAWIAYVPLAYLIWVIKLWG